MAGISLVVLLSVGNTAQDNESLFCSCAPGISFDHTLPLSHPINKCAATQSDAVSWLSWVSGQSSSYQFHFIDLLELLSRNTDYTQEKYSKVDKSADK